MQQVSFSLQPGEIVGFLGPNGAGKTTTLKMLSACCTPPAARRACWARALSARTTTCADHPGDGQPQPAHLGHSRPWTRSVNQAVYRHPGAPVPADAGRADRAAGPGAAAEQAGAQPLAGRADEVRAGRRAAAPPAVLFLDEPTIGLDVTMQRASARFIAEYNRRTGATILLTSHYMADVTALCKRVIVIHQGKPALRRRPGRAGDRMAPFKLIGSTWSRRKRQRAPISTAK